MRRTALAVAGIAGLLMTLNIDVGWLNGLSALTLLVVSGLSLIFRAKPPKDLLMMLVTVLFGPYLVSILVRLLLGSLLANLPNFPTALVLVILMTASFLYVRYQILRKRHSDKQLHTNERQPLLPANKEVDEGMVEDERD